MAVYLLHFSDKSHYVGYSNNPRRRVQEHARCCEGKSACFVAEKTAQNVTWQLAHIWQDWELPCPPLEFEAWLHEQQKLHPRFLGKRCPVCQGSKS